jgi:iron complex outermembrane receptor protein
MPLIRLAAPRRRVPLPTVAAAALGPLLACSLAAGSAVAADGATGAEPVVVTGSLKAQRILAAPFAIGAVDTADLREAGPMINLSEALPRIPGLVVANRNNYAQDLQISSRGFGARAGFGVRGIRLYTDGIPATMPDGQGQVAHFDLAGAARVEVLRGPFSVLYGNSSGGVISLFTAPAPQARGELALDAGPYGLRQVRAAVGTPLPGGFDLKASAVAMAIDGFRPHSAADRQLANARLGWTGERDSVVVLASYHDQKADDPLGLRPEDWAVDPYQTTPEATQYDTRKTVSQTQLGAQWRHRFDAGPLREGSLMGYAGRRSVVQFLAIPPLTQRNPALPPARWERQNGGVVDFDRDYDGIDARLRFGWETLDLEVGAVQENQRDDRRRGYENFTGDPTAPTALGVIGNLRRDEVDTATTRDLFAQAEWTLGPAVSLIGGVRSGRVDVEVRDDYTSGINGDDSGQLQYDYTNPVLGLRWTLNPGWTAHASLARGFESPTLGELAYTPDNSGFNTKLEGQTSRQIEVGVKVRGGALDVDAALFHVDTDDEIGVSSNVGGRSTFQNVGRTRRYGAELAGAWRITPTLRARLAASLLHATYRDDFQTCVVAGCPTAAPQVTVNAGNRIAGTQRALGWADLSWRPGPVPGEFGIELRGQSQTAANDVNTVFAPGFGIVNLRWNHAWPVGALGELQTLVRVENVADRAFVGSVIVNDGNRRFFETGTPRAWQGSVRWVSRW